MKTFKVEIKTIIPIKAESLQEANEKLNDMELIARESGVYDQEFNVSIETVSFFDNETSINHEVIGHCELSGLSIFEEDHFGYNDRGTMWLKQKGEPEFPEELSYENFMKKNGLVDMDMIDDVSGNFDRL